MSASKTVTVAPDVVEEDGRRSDSMSLLVNQAHDVNAMRNTLLSFDKNDPSAAKRAIQNVTVLRIYHQMSRIVRYTELMDKIEDKLYCSIEAYIDQADEMNPETMSALLRLQERLQASMIESHKLLEPYLNAQTFSLPEITTEQVDDSFATRIMDQASREKIRTSALRIMEELKEVDTE